MKLFDYFNVLAVGSDEATSYLVSLDAGAVSLVAVGVVPTGNLDSCALLVGLSDLRQVNIFVDSDRRLSLHFLNSLWLSRGDVLLTTSNVVTVRKLVTGRLTYLNHLRHLDSRALLHVTNLAG